MRLDDQPSKRLLNPCLNLEHIFGNFAVGAEHHVGQPRRGTELEVDPRKHGVVVRVSLPALSHFRHQVLGTDAVKGCRCVAALPSNQNAVLRADLQENPRLIGEEIHCAVVIGRMNHCESQRRDDADRTGSSDGKILIVGRDFQTVVARLREARVKKLTSQFGVVLSNVEHSHLAHQTHVPASLCNHLKSLIRVPPVRVVLDEDVLFPRRWGVRWAPEKPWWASIVLEGEEVAGGNQQVL